MADSCRPVSRHGRYNANHDRSDVQYSENLPSYSTVEYRGPEDFYGSRQSPVVMETFERPQTGRGFRRIRPPSRGGREEVFDESKTGRPSSRVGFRPDTYDRHDYDEFSRQKQPVVSDNNSETDESLPGGGNNSPVSSPIPYRRASPTPEQLIGSPQNMTVSPNEEYLSAQSPSAYRLLYRDTVGHNSPDRSSHHVTPRHRHTQNPRLGRHEPQDEQVFEFDDQQHLDRGHQEHYVPHFGEQYLDPQVKQIYGDCRPPSRDSPRSKKSQSPFKDNEEMPCGYTPILSGRNRYQYEHYQHTDQSNRQDVSEVMPVHEGPSPTPRPTSSRPRSSRPKSARKRPQSGRKQKEQHYQQEDSQNQEYDSSAPVRPHSSFLRYKPLPAIGTNDTMSNQERAEELAEQTRQLHLQETIQQRPGSARNRPGSASYRPGSASYRPGSASYSIPESAQPLSTASDTSSNGQTYSNSHKNTENEIETEKSDDVNQYDGRIHLHAFKPHKLPEEPKENETRILLAIRLPDGKRVQRYFRVAERIELVKLFAENAANSDFSDYNLSCNAPKTVFTNLSQMICDAGLVDRTLLFLVEQKQ